MRLDAGGRGGGGGGGRLGPGSAHYKQPGIAMWFTRLLRCSARLVRGAAAGTRERRERPQTCRAKTNSSNCLLGN